MGLDEYFEFYSCTLSDRVGHAEKSCLASQLCLLASENSPARALVRLTGTVVRLTTKSHHQQPWRQQSKRRRRKTIVGRHQDSFVIICFVSHVSMSIYQM